MGSIDIPKRQRAAVKVGNGSDAKAPVQEIDVQMPGPEQILVKINWYADLSRESIMSNKPGLACVHPISR